ncbi:Actin-like 6A [Boothiomyces sp. JEL0838]|nr:Actin-like 6A [Boothiomyces sp. JEL0838]
MVQFGGDEVSALVFDFGSCTSKVGYAGEDTPRAVFPSVVGKFNDPNAMDTDKKVFIGETEIYRPKRGLEIVSPFHDGAIQNWEVYEQLWEYTYQKLLKTQSSEHPVMFADPSWDTKENREKLCELAFEKFNVPGFYLGRSAVLSSFAAGRSTALVIESGASSTSVVPVLDGYVVKKAIQKSPIGGDFVSKQVRQYFQMGGIDLTPQCLIKQKAVVPSGAPPQFQTVPLDGITRSFGEFSMGRIVHEFKESVCQVAETAFNERELRKKPVKNFEFPTGFNNLYSLDRFKLTEALFQPSFIINATPNAIPPTIPQLISQSVSACEVELQPILHSNAVLSGANSLLPGFSDRVYNELHRLSPGGRIKVQAAGGSSERRFGPWIGGSIMASMSSFHQLWISKSQYEEMGVGVEKRIH